MIKKHKKSIILLLILLIVTGSFVFPVQSGFLVKSGDEKYYLFHPNNSNEIVVGWRHSVELTPWKESYRVMDNGKFSLQSTTYKSYGAGTPDTEGTAEVLDNGFILVKDIERVIPYYSLFYIPISHYFLEIDGVIYELAEYVPNYSNVQIHYKKLRLYEWIWLKFTFWKGGTEIDE